MSMSVSSAARPPHRPSTSPAAHSTSSADSRPSASPRAFCHDASDGQGKAQSFNVCLAFAVRKIIPDKAERLRKGIASACHAPSRLLGDMRGWPG